MNRTNPRTGHVDRRLLERLCVTVATVTRFDAAILTVWGESGDPAVGSHGISKSRANDLARLILPARDTGAGGGGAQGSADGSFRQRLTEFGFTSSSRVPVTRDDQVIGLLVVLAAEPRHPDPPLLSALARVCESALEYRQAPTAAPDLTDLDALVLSTDSFTTLIEAMTVALSAKLGEVGVGLSVADDDTGLLITADGSFGLPASVTRRFPIDPGDLHSNAARVFELQQPFASNHVIGDPAVLQNYPQAFGIRSMLALPLVVAARSIGVLMIVNKENGFDADDMGVVLPVLPRLSLAVELTRLSERRRFAYEADGIVAALRIAALASPPDETRITGIVDETRRLLAADHLAVHRGRAASSSGSRMEIPSRGPLGSLMELPCGGNAGNLVLRAERASNGFGRSERALLADLAQVLSEAASLQQTRRQEEELAQHRERQRIADDLHDDVSQLLFAAQLALTAEPEPEVPRAIELVRTAEAALRDAIFLLEAPPDPLSRQIEGTLASVREQWGLAIESVIEQAVDGVSDPTGAELLRAARECLVNAAKHSDASRVRITVRVVDDGRSVELVVVDDGVGLSELDGGKRTSERARRPETMKHGLRAMHRRAEAQGGELTVESLTTGGTRASLRLPVGPG
ncbi:GAF domain-containing protein [Leucobacter sp. CSA1]|uniref:GAF domain-containing protein n=1 Tax=Leucobacter chromiisoli TaxID=2796471 RepID=A0A934Q7D5_9MICO|nr:GAF domain-containing protein [Leucobacter chromiisoli]MBK0418813.1 GAF domain-containing protein [Leucobacter chromiisoli]